MNYQAVYDYVSDLSQNLGVGVKFFHGRKEWLNYTKSDKPLYLFMLPLSSNGSILDSSPIESWTLSLIFYQRDEADSAINQNNEGVMQDEMRTLSITSSAADKFLRLFGQNSINEDLEEASDGVTISNFTKGNAIKDTAYMLTGTTLDITFSVRDSFNYCCEYLGRLEAPSDFTFSNPTSETIEATIVSNSGGQEDGFKWYISDDDITYTIAGATTDTEFVYSGLDSGTTYYGKALAFGFSDSEFSNTDSETTQAQYQPESQAFFDRQPDISEFEKSIVDIMVVSAKAVGNLSSLDEWFIPLKDGDSRVGFFSKTGDLFGGSFIDSNGLFDFDGANGYFDTNFNPNVDGSKYQLNNSVGSVFVKEHRGGGSERVFGGHEPSGNMFSLFNNSSNSTVQYGVNNSSAAILESSPYKDNTLYSIDRTELSNQKGYIDGVAGATSINASIGIPNTTIFIGAAHWVGGAIIQYFEGKVGFFAIGSGVGFDHASYNEYTRIYIASLIDGSVVPDLATANTIIDNA